MHYEKICGLLGVSPVYLLVCFKLPIFLILAGSPSVYAHQEIKINCRLQPGVAGCSITVAKYKSPQESNEKLPLSRQ